MAEGTYTIVYTVDGNESALRWLSVSLRSLREKLGHGVRVVVCTDSPRDFGFGSECVDVRPVISKYGIGRISKLEWYGKPVAPMQVFRLALPLVPELSNAKKVVFVDADTEFLDARWADVFHVELSGASVAGVIDGGKDDRFIASRFRDFHASGIVMSEARVECVERVRSGKYANGGVLVMDLDAMRSENGGDYVAYLGRMLELCVRARLKYLDQDVINLFFDVATIPSRYNSSDHLHSPGEPTYLEHYTGKEKWTSAVYPPVKYQLLHEDGRPDIVYTVGKPSEHDDQELRWSLRSIAKYGSNFGRVIVASPYERKWLSAEVVHVDSQDMPNAGYKHHNILKSILDTVDCLNIEGTFFVSSDDHFYVRPVDFSDQPLVAQRWSIPQNMGSSSNLHTMLWKTSCSDTRSFLIERGLPTIDFQMHRNSKWHGGLVRERRELFKEAMRLRFCVEPHVLMQNLWLHTQPDARVEFRRDAKIKEFHGIETWCDCISCYDSTFLDDRFVRFMEGEFGEKCRFER